MSPPADFVLSRGDQFPALGTGEQLARLERRSTARLLSDIQPRRRTTVAERILRQYLDGASLRRVLDAGLADRLRERRFAR